MRVISRSTLKEHYEKPGRTDSREALEAWYHEAIRASWKSPADVKQKYGTASILKNSRVVFNICGNKYRLVVRISYQAQLILVRFVGTHKEYDSINAEEI